MLMLFAVSASAGNFFGLFDKQEKGSGDIVTETRDVDNFKRIKSTGAFDIFVTVGEEPSLKITFDDNLIEFIDTDVSGRTLILESHRSYRSKHGCKVEITVPKLEYVKLSGSGDIVVTNLKSDFFEYQLSGSGDLSAEGEVEELEVSISGSGDIDTRDLIAQDVYAKVSGSGNIKVYAKNSFNGKVSGSGDIYYYGNPEAISTSVSGSGSIRKKR